MNFNLTPFFIPPQDDGAFDIEKCYAVRPPSPLESSRPPLILGPFAGVFRTSSRWTETTTTRPTKRLFPALKPTSRLHSTAWCRACVRRRRRNAVRSPSRSSLARASSSGLTGAHSPGPFMTQAVADQSLSSSCRYQLVGEEKRKPPVKVDLNTAAGEEVVAKTVWKDSVRFFAFALRDCPPR